MPTKAENALPPEVTDNLAPLRSFVSYATTDGDLSKFVAFLQIK